MILERHGMVKHMEGMAQRLMEQSKEGPHKLHPIPQLTRRKGSAEVQEEGWGLGWRGLRHVIFWQGRGRSYSSGCLGHPQVRAGQSLLLKVP